MKNESKGDLKMEDKNALLDTSYDALISAANSAKLFIEKGFYELAAIELDALKRFARVQRDATLELLKTTK